MDLQAKKTSLQALLEQKVQQFQNADNIRNQLANEITELRGRIQMLDEIIKESPEKEVPKEEVKEEKK